MNILSDLIPAKARKAVYAVVGLLSLLAAIPDLFPASWAPKVVAVLAALSSALAVGNVAPKDKPGGDPPKDAGFVMLRLLVVLSLVAAFMLAVGAAIPADAAGSFTIDRAPAVGQVSTIDGSELCPAGGCSFTTSVTYRTPGCCGRVVTIVQLGRTAVVQWAASALDATHGYVTIVMVVGIPNPANHLVRTTTFQQSVVVAT